MPFRHTRPMALAMMIDRHRRRRKFTLPRWAHRLAAGLKPR
jgi:hypothetical protein